MLDYDPWGYPIRAADGSYPGQCPPPPVLVQASEPVATTRARKATPIVVQPKVVQAPRVEVARKGKGKVVGDGQRRLF